MLSKRSKLILWLSVGVILIFILKETFTQSGIKELSGGFTEVAKYRNENNTGPIQQLYIVSLSDTTGAQLLDYGNLMPHHKYGITKVYFFVAGTDMPTSLSPGEINFDPHYNTSCFVLYRKNAMGEVELIRKPFNP